ncbi:MAG: helix-turn-helix domain-containing protein, partial [Alphaproteobacteria bacterium]|nr:helix-turn-helix domain-containing protein [Alphaproteobacteria bacterium]
MVWLSPRSFRVLDEAARPQAGGGDHVGLVLREARLAAGYEIGQIATSLRIRHGYLAAIEDGRFDVLP